MLPYPYIYSRKNLLTGIALFLSAVMTLGGLLFGYGDISLAGAITDAFVFLVLLTAAGISSWFFFAYIRVWQAQVVLTLSLILICLCVCFAAVSVFELEDGRTFVRLLPLRILVGVCSWVILMQWYRIKYAINEEKKEQEEMETVEEKNIEPATNDPIEYLDRISVRDSGRIHIVPINELLYIQASGDYATLFTSTGQFVKENSMKYFETHLPSTTFIRIHRSTIVNTDYILRIELFEKTNYNVRLKNGANLRASLAGYRLLKEKLDL